MERLDRGDFLSALSLELLAGAEVGAVVEPNVGELLVLFPGVLGLLLPLREDLDDLLLPLDLGELLSMMTVHKAVNAVFVLFKHSSERSL